MLRYDFVSCSPASRPHFEISTADMLEELKRELDHRRRYFPQRVAKGAMTQDEADQEEAVLADIIADVAAVADFQAASASHWRANGALAYSPAFPLPRRDAAFGWEPKLHCLRREIHLRRKFYPEWIRKGRISEGLAREQLERLEAVQVRYWLDLWGRPRGTFAEHRSHYRRIEAAIGWPLDTGGVPTNESRSASGDPQMNERAPEPALL
jgi:hypothetical protein